MGAALALGLRLADADDAQIGEAVRPGVEARLRRAVPVGAIDHRGVHVARVQRRDDIALAGDALGGAGARYRHPDRRMRLLPGARPDIHLAVVVVPALPVERPVMGRHRLDDEVMRLPEALLEFGRIGVGGVDLEGRALDEAHLHPAAADDVEHGVFLGHAHRVHAVADRHAEAEQAGLFGLARQDRHRDGADRGGAGRRGMVLVHHDVEAEPVAERPFVEIAVVEVRADLRVIDAARDHVAQAFVQELPARVVSHLAEMPDLHHLLSTKARIASAVASARSIWG